MTPVCQLCAGRTILHDRRQLQKVQRARENHVHVACPPGSEKSTLGGEAYHRL